MGAGGEPLGQFEFGLAVRASGAGGYAVDDSFGPGQHRVGHAGLPGEVEGIPFHTGEGADLQFDGVDRMRLCFADLFRRDVDDALYDG